MTDLRVPGKPVRVAEVSLMAVHLAHTSLDSSQNMRVLCH